jgi:hypothetical protein
MFLTPPSNKGTNMNKKMAAAGLAAGLIAGTGAGFILQLTGSAGAAGTSISATDPVDESADSERPDRSERLLEVLQPLVEDGTLTQAQLDSVIETLVAAGPMGGEHGGRGGRGPGLEIVASTLGMTPEEVREAISNGQTLAQLAEANGSDGQALIDAILAEMKTHLDEKVAAGDLTQEEADAKLAEATTRVTEFVNNTDEAGPMGGRGRGPRGGDAEG